MPFLRPIVLLFLLGLMLAGGGVRAGESVAEARWSAEGAAQAGAGDFRESLAAMQRGAEGWAEREYRAHIVGILRQGQFAGAVAQETPVVVPPVAMAAPERSSAFVLLALAVALGLGLYWRRSRVLAEAGR